MLWIWEEEVLPGSDYGAFVQRCRDLDLNGISRDVCREDPEAPPPIFVTLCAWFYAWQRPHALLEVFRPIWQLEMDDSLVAV